MTDVELSSMCSGCFMPWGIDQHFLLQKENGGIVFDDAALFR
jgi:hypothetical protein